MLRVLMLLGCTALLSSTADAQWKNWINLDPITDRPRANAQVEANELVNYDRPTLFYSCEVKARGDVEQRIQVETREIHSGNEGTVIFRVDGGEPIQFRARNWGDYKQAPTIVRQNGEGSIEYQTKADRLSSMDQTRAELLSELDAAKAAENEVLERQISGKISMIDRAREYVSEANTDATTERLPKFDRLVRALQSAQRSIVVRTSEVTFTVPVSGSTRTINRAKAHCGVS